MAKITNTKGEQFEVPTKIINALYNMKVVDKCVDDHYKPKHEYHINPEMFPYDDSAWSSLRAAFE